MLLFFYGKQLDELGGSFELPKVPLHMGMHVFAPNKDTGEPGYETTVFPCVAMTLPSELRAFLEESLLMKDFDHPNILNLVGVCFDTPDEIPFIILPLMANGSLKDYLIKKRKTLRNSNLPVPILPKVFFFFYFTHVLGQNCIKDYTHLYIAGSNCGNSHSNVH